MKLLYPRIGATQVAAEIFIGKASSRLASLLLTKKAATLKVAAFLWFFSQLRGEWRTADPGSL